MIREFKKEDSNQVMKIWLETNRKTHSFIEQEYWKKNEKEVKKAILDAQVYVYEEDKIVVGFVGIVDGYIAGIFVEEKKQNKGIGKQLIEECKRRYTKLNLKVYEKNKRAIQFYQREDFKIRNKKLEKDTQEIELLMEWNRK